MQLWGGDNGNRSRRGLAGVAAMTFDVEEWFHARNLRIPRCRWPELPSRLERSVDRILALLDHYDTRATFFTLGWVAERLPTVVRRIHAAGHEIASHGFWHQPITEQTPIRFREDVRTSKVALEELTGEAVTGYRAPGYSIGPKTDWALDELEQVGFAYDSSIYPARAPHGRYGVPASPLRPHRVRPGLWEFPLPTWQVLGCRIPVATGAYLRLCPFAVTKRAINQNLRHAIPVVINLHPWELDADQPRRPAPLFNRLLHYTNLHTTRRKLVRLLETYKFRPLRELRALYEPVPVSTLRSLVEAVGWDGPTPREAAGANHDESVSEAACEPSESR